MTAKITRRRAVVTLFQGNYEAELADLMERAMSALRVEEAGQKRAASKSTANALAREFDAKTAEAEETAEKVTVWALRYDQMQDLEDEHPARDGDATDARFGVNMRTFPKALLEASLVDPSTTSDLSEIKTAGAAALADLDVRKAHYKKLETAAWNVNVGDDNIPKESLTLLLKQARDPDSKQQPDSE